MNMNNYRQYKYNLRSYTQSLSGSDFLEELRQNKTNGKIINDVLFQLEGIKNTQSQINMFAEKYSLSSLYRRDIEYKWLQQFANRKRRHNQSNKENRYQNQNEKSVPIFKPGIKIKRKKKAGTRVGLYREFIQHENAKKGKIEIAGTAVAGGSETEPKAARSVNVSS